MQISRLFGHTLQTLKNGIAMSSLGLTSTSGDIVFFSVKQAGKCHRDSSLVNKTDYGAVPQLPFPGNPEQVTCFVMIKALASQIGCMFAFLMFFF